MMVDFCLPVRNEEKILALNVKRLEEFLLSRPWPFSWQITILLNDCSDSSLEIATKLQAESAGKICFVNYLEKGKGPALKKYFQTSASENLVFMDVDLAVSLENIPALIDPLVKNESDLIIGSRLLPQSMTVRSWPREFISRTYNALSRHLLHHQLSDLQCGFKALKKEVFTKVAPYLDDDIWFFDTELVFFAKYFGYRVREIPVDWQENRYAERASKIRVFRDTASFIINLWRLRARAKNLTK